MFTHYTVVVNSVNEKIPTFLYRIWTILLFPFTLIVLGIGAFNNMKVGALDETFGDGDDIFFRFNKQSDVIRLMRLNKLLLVTDQTLYYR